MVKADSGRRVSKTLGSIALFLVGLVSCLSLAIVAWSPARLAMADGGLQWDHDVNLSSSTSASSRGEIVADDYGHVHVFWEEDLDGAAVVDRSTWTSDERFHVDLRATTILYRQWDGTQWTPPVDLFAPPGGNPGAPTAAIDDANQLYLLMDRVDGIYFSTAPANAAGSAAAWSKEWRIADSTGGLGPHMVARGQGQLDIVFGAAATDGSRDGNVYHMRSTDGGQTWSEQHRISSIDTTGSELSVWARLAVDRQGTLHVVWTQVDGAGLNTQSVWYSRSTDEGSTWSPPLQVDRTDAKWINARGIQVVASSDGKLHLVWVCGEQAFRCHMISQDGGVTWGGRQRIFGEMASFANLDAITTDRQTGQVYMVLQLRPSALYYSVLEGDQWLDPPRLVDDGWLHEGHNTRAAAINGNELHVVTDPPGTAEVGYIHGINPNAPRVPPHATPTQRPPTPVAVATVRVSPTASPTPKRIPSAASLPPLDSGVNLSSSSSNLWLSVAPVVALIAGVLLLAMIRAR